MPVPPIQRRRHRNRRRKRLSRTRRRPVGAPAAADSAVAEVGLAELLARGPALVLVLRTGGCVGLMLLRVLLGVCGSFLLELVGVAGH